MTTRDLQNIFGISKEWVHKFAKSRGIEPRGHNDWGIEWPRVYVQELRAQINDKDDPKVAKIIADTEKAKAETELKRLDFEIKQKNYIRAELVHEVLADVVKSLSKKVHNLHHQVTDLKDLERECALVCEQLSAELEEKSAALELGCED